MELVFKDCSLATLKFTLPSYSTTPCVWPKPFPPICPHILFALCKSLLFFNLSLSLPASPYILPSTPLTAFCLLHLFSPNHSYSSWVADPPTCFRDYYPPLCPLLYYLILMSSDMGRWSRPALCTADPRAGQLEGASMWGTRSDQITHYLSWNLPYVCMM